MDAPEVGRRLAERHVTAPEPDTTHSLLNYAEVPYEGDWTLRSAFVRLAQPDPVRVGSVLELMRRLDALLHHVRRCLERHAVTCDRAVTADGVAGPPVAPYADVRTADLARLVAGGVEEHGLLTGYEERVTLEHEERMAVPLLAVAVELEELAATLAAWALVGPADPPLEAVDRIRAHVASRLDELGVPVETGPPPGVGRSGRR